MVVDQVIVALDVVHYALRVGQSLVELQSGLFVPLAVASLFAHQGEQISKCILHLASAQTLSVLHVGELAAESLDALKGTAAHDVTLNDFDHLAADLKLF